MHEVEIAILEELCEVAAGAISKVGNFSRVGIAADDVSQTPEVSILPFHRSSLPSILESGRSSSVTRGQCPLTCRQQSSPVESYDHQKYAPICCHSRREVD